MTKTVKLNKLRHLGAADINPKLISKSRKFVTPASHTRAKTKSGPFLMRNILKWFSVFVLVGSLHGTTYSPHK